MLPRWQIIDYCWKMIDSLSKRWYAASSLRLLKLNRHLKNQVNMLEIGLTWWKFISTCGKLVKHIGN